MMETSLGLSVVLVENLMRTKIKCLGSTSTYLKDVSERVLAICLKRLAVSYVLISIIKRIILHPTRERITHLS